MRVLRVNDINEALPMGIQLLQNCHIVITPRKASGGETWECPEPVTTVYNYPKGRVLFSPLRNKNHFFELFEALWILAGRKDAAFLTQFNKQMGAYANADGTYDGAYGHRLKHHQGFNQLRALIALLKREPDTRRAVLQIWDATSDLNKESLDIPCNDLLFFKLRNGKLNLSVANRSNDIIWGAYGTNAVQFSMILEYVATILGVKVGTYRQVSDSYHLYPGLPIFEKLRNISIISTLNPYREPQAAEVLSRGRISDVVHSTPFILPKEGETMDDFMDDIIALFSFWDSDTLAIMKPDIFNTEYFQFTVFPMYMAWETKNRDWLDLMPKYSDWRLGAEVWFQNRDAKRKE